MRRLVLASLVLSTFTPAAFAQAHKGAAHVAPSHPAHNPAPHPNNTVHAPNFGAMNFPNNTMNFPNNGAMNFPNNGAMSFPNNGAMNFPNNGVIHFPNNGGLNSPNNGAMSFPSYNSGISNNAVPFNAVGTANGSNGPTPASQMAAMMAMPMGVGSITQGMTYHPSYAHHSHYPSRNRSVVHSPTNRPMPYTPTQRHYLKVVQDLDSLPPRFVLAHSHRVMFNNDLMALSEVSPRPAITAVRQLSDSLAEAMTRRKSQVFNTSAVTGHLQVVLNANRFSKGETDDAVAQTQSLMRDAGFSKADMQTVAAEMQKVAADARAAVVQQAAAPAPK